MTVKPFRHKLLFTVALAILSCCLANYVCGQETLSRIEKLNIGRFQSNLSFLGTCLGHGSWGRISNHHYFPFFNVFENPAFIFGEKQPKIIFHLSPALHYGLSKITKLSSYINPEIDNNIASYRPADLTIGYPTINLQIKRQKRFAEGLILFPFKNFTCGLLFHHPLLLEMNYNLIGAESSVSTNLSSESGSGKVILNNYLDAVNQLNYLTTSSSFMIAGRWNSKLIHCLQLERLYFEVNLLSNWNIQGSMYYNGKEHLFNDQATLWPTAIGQNLQAHYSGTGWRVSYGGMYLVTGNCIIDGLISFSSSATLKGDLSGTRHKIPALNLKALEESGGIEEILDGEKLDPSQLTYTETLEWNNYPSAKHTMPNKFKIGFYFKTESWKFYLSDHFYFGQYRLLYGDEYVELLPKQKLNLYFCHHHFFTDIELFFFKYHAPESQDLAVNSSLTILPCLALGYGRSILKPLTLIGVIDLLPVPGVNLGLQYQF